MMKEVTTIVIAHRLSTIRHADKIIVMKKGKIVEEGTHESIHKEWPNGTYARMLEIQEAAEA